MNWRELGVGRWANRLHRDQKYGDEPYVVHLEAAANVLERFGYFHTEEDSSDFLAAYSLRIAVFLHDALEDTRCTAEEIAELDSKAAEIVQLVTDKSGKNRAERHAATYPGIRGHFLATAVKLADRIANVEHSILHDSHDKFSMYQKEYGYFRDTLYQPSEHDQMWKWLDYLLKYVPDNR